MRRVPRCRDASRRGPRQPTAASNRRATAPHRRRPSSRRCDPAPATPTGARRPSPAPPRRARSAGRSASRRHAEERHVSTRPARHSGRRNCPVNPVSVSISPSSEHRVQGRRRSRDPRCRGAARRAPGRLDRASMRSTRAGTRRASGCAARRCRRQRRRTRGCGRSTIQPSLSSLLKNRSILRGACQLSSSAS